MQIDERRTLKTVRWPHSPDMHCLQLSELLRKEDELAIGFITKVGFRMKLCMHCCA